MHRLCAGVLLWRKPSPYLQAQSDAQNHVERAGYSKRQPASNNTRCVQHHVLNCYSMNKVQPPHSPVRDANHRKFVGSTISAISATPSRTRANCLTWAPTKMCQTTRYGSLTLQFILLVAQSFDWGVWLYFIWSTQRKMGSAASRFLYDCERCHWTFNVGRRAGNRPKW